MIKSIIKTSMQALNTSRMPLKLQHKHRKKAKGNASIEYVKSEENIN
jgi:hypothetical protein